MYLSQSQSALGLYKDAEASAIKAIKSLDDDLLGKPMVIRRQGVAHMALADAYTGQKRYDEALKEYKYAEEIFTHISSHLAFDDMSELYARLVENGIARRDINTTRYYKIKHLETFDGLHPRYILIVKNLTTRHFCKRLPRGVKFEITHWFN